MGQQEVGMFLKENKGKWFKPKEIAEGLNHRQGISSIGENLRKLAKADFIKRRGTAKHYEYSHKGR